MIAWFLVLFSRTLLWLRYRVRVTGLEAAAGRGRSGILFLPNHPALIDPILVLSRLWPTFAPRALADEKQIDRFFIRFMARQTGVLAIPELSRAEPQSRRRTAETLEACIAALQDGQNVLIYPAGGLCRSRFENLGGKSAVERILRQAPEVRIVLVRTRGLWGSRFSWAGGRRPQVGPTLRRAVVWLLSSGIFFAPRRQVTIELVEPDDVPRAADRNTLNRYLERFYNTAVPANTHVPYTIWERGARPRPEPAGPRAAGTGDVHDAGPGPRGGQPPAA